VLSNAWVRPVVKGQRVTGGYLQIKALEAVTLLAVASSVAGQSELHEMKMDGDVMRMRALPSLSIAAGQTVSLQPGGNHLMLMGLKQPIAAGAKVPLTLKFRNASGQVFERSVTADARSTAPSGGAASGARHDAAAHGHHGDHHDHHDHH
jgi:copper(I)-binding protein